MKVRNLIIVFVLAAIALTACASPAATTTAPEPTAAMEQPTAAMEQPTAAMEQPTAAMEEPTTASAPVGEPDVCSSDAFGCAKIEPGQTIKIGMGAPLTGDNAQFGVDISQGATIAIQDAGEFQGFKFELDAEDDGGTPEGGASVANKFVADPQIVAIAGHIFSGATQAAIPIYEKAGIPMMSPSATNPDLTKAGSTVFNRVAFTDAAQGKFAAEYLFNTLGFTKIAVMHDGQAYGQGLAEVVANHFTELGGEIVAEEAITPGESDYTAPLSAIAAKGPQAVYYGGYVQEAVVLVNEWNQAGLTGVVFFGCDGTYGADFINRTGANGEGSYAVALIPPASDAVTKFNAAYKSEFGADAGTLSPYSWNAYDSAATLIYAIEQVAIKSGDGNLYIPRGALVQAVRGIKDYHGLSGDLTCDSVGECNASGPIFYIVQDGAWVPASN